MKKSIPKIIWHYQYLQGCKEVNVNDEIDITPDKHNRWQIRGSLMVKTSALPNYKWAGRYISVPVAYIHQKGTKGSVVPSTVNNFACNFSYIYDANLGYGDFFFYGNTPNEVMIKVQEAFEKTYRCFMSLK